jgi:L-lactate dehydrogenase complex protein LldG
MSARDEMLATVRGAVGSGDSALAARPVPRGYRHDGASAAGSPELVEQLVDRLEDYRATVVRAAGADEVIGDAVAKSLSGKDIREAVVPPGLPAAWVGGLEKTHDDGQGRFTARELDGIPAVVTGSAVAISETGTIALDATPVCGRRIISLVPDTHVCVVRVADIVQTVPEGVARLDPLRPLTLISGPSATSDIELSRVEGVHGPRTLIVIVAG